MTSRHPNLSLTCLGDRIVLKGSRISRRQRAKKACTHCRARKVRCDININGWPCTVCREDSSECMIVARKRVVHRKKAAPSMEQSSQLSKDLTLSWRDDLELTRGPGGENSIVEDFEVKLASISVSNTHKTHVALSPCDALQLEEGTSARSNASELPYSSQDCTQLCNIACDDWSCTNSSDTKSDISILSPLDHDQSYDFESPYSKETESVHWIFEVDQHTPSEATISWRASGLWSILSEGEWPRLD